MQINVLEYLEQVWKRFPDKLAVVDGGGSLDFQTLVRQAHGIAREVEARVPMANLPVAIYLPKSRESIAAILGTLYGGCCYAPLDTKAPMTRIESILKHLEPALVITNKTLGATLGEAKSHSGSVLFIEDILPATGSPPLRWRECLDTDPVYIIHTSGSTGRPKGVVIPHRGVIDYIDWARDCYRIDSSCVIGNQAPLIFDNSTLDLYLSFACGATLNLIPEELFLFPMRLLEYLAQHAINFIFWVPSIMVSVANKGVLGKVPGVELRTILFAGEVMPARQLNRWRAQFPNALFSNLYGPTEITVDCTYYIVDRELSDDEPVPIGRACRNSGILILNERNGPCGLGERGELCVRGSSLAMGYWNQPEQTAAAFVQNPLNPHYPEVIYRTGDLVYTNDRHEIIFVGRKDFQIKHMGYRIELGEIEHCAQQIPGLRQACVLYHDARKEIVLAYEGDSELEPGFIRSELGKSLPKYMWPTVFKRLPELPRNPSGKIDRQALMAQLGA